LTTGHPAPFALFLGSGYAGHYTRFQNLKAQSATDPRIRADFRLVSGWRKDGLIERMPMLPKGLKGRLRAAVEATTFARLPRPDIIWTSAREALLPHLWVQIGPWRRPIVLDLDWTLEQREDWAPAYYGRAPRAGLRLGLARLQERLLWRQVTFFTPWSNWTAEGLRRQGVSSERIRVIPPGIDLRSWQARSRLSRDNGRSMRLLFVGGEFARKGGDIILDVLQNGLAGRCELDIVTRAQVRASPGVRVHRLESNSRELRDLYARADLFVLPSRAECFGIATVEAMASGLPAIVSDVGGAADIVDHGRTGWLIEPTAAALSRALEQALDAGDSLSQMGTQARTVAEERFDESKNARRVVKTLLEAQAIRKEASTLKAAPRQGETL
jgi:glycosyltransferase involved in cell wall biosynthesis